MKIVKNFQRDDCLHYKMQPVRGCCGKSTQNAGFCTIPDEDGAQRSKICSMKMSYCAYQPKEEEDVHIKEL